MKKLLTTVILTVATFLIANMAFSVQHSILLSIIVLLVTLWTNEALPLGVVSLLPILLFPSFDILSTNATTVNYSKSIIFLFLGGFMIAIATQKTDLHKYIANKLLTLFPNTPRGIIFSLAITSAVLSSLISNTTTALLLIPIAMFLTKDMKLKLRLVLSIAYGASIGGILTPIGTPPNLILLGFMEQHNMEPIAFVQWIVLALPLVVIMLVLIPFVLSLGVNHLKFDTHLEQREHLTSDQRRLLYILGSLIVLLFVNSKIEPYYSGLGINEKGILLGFGLLMFIPKIGFLNWEDTKKIPYEIIFLFGAGFSIAAAFSSTGLANEIANYLLALTHMPVILLILLVASLITFTTEVTSNTALISIALPIIYSLGKAANIDVNLILFVSTICASYAFMLPIATPPNAIAMSSGAVKVKDMATFGLIFNFLGIISITIVALVYWQFYL
ncbi:anion transporter [Malaciobacter molluscorum LMG 25693]|uniref:Anion transporter n=1 Tax=Malaciobacter molluscorum LMG 25693 TaxID=870501 RepID=A0A2G1DLV0_9BACT|nr:SLC13 family permease [Malaciobacter molluscorum]AXX92241.1 sodium:dicarboxylate cotransporter (permease SLC13 domain) [Malaciobacter molluscorum LMG 25693]PHO19468.1 anion transporter [Malaciobacter molluscorum LMG 25693]RXJ96309.1 anion transporter [Malaciobacter molluscorum]